MNLLRIVLGLYDSDGNLLDRRASPAFLSEKINPEETKEVEVRWENVTKVIKMYSSCGVPAPMYLSMSKKGLVLEYRNRVSNKKIMQSKEQLELYLHMRAVSYKPHSIKEILGLNDFDKAMRYLKEYMDKME